MKFRASGQIIHVQEGEQPAATDAVAAFCSTPEDAAALVLLLNLATDIGDQVAPLVADFVEGLDKLPARKR